MTSAQTRRSTRQFLHRAMLCIMTSIQLTFLIRRRRIKSNHSKTTYKFRSIYKRRRRKWQFSRTMSGQGHRYPSSRNYQIRWVTIQLQIYSVTKSSILLNLLHVSIACQGIPKKLGHKGKHFPSLLFHSMTLKRILASLLRHWT